MELEEIIGENDYSKAISIAGNKHDLIAIQVYDTRETQLPNIGLIKFKDLETGTEQWVDTSSKNTRNVFSKWWYERQRYMNETLKKAKVDIATISTCEDYVKILRGLFQNRSSR